MSEIEKAKGGKPTKTSRSGTIQKRLSTRQQKDRFLQEYYACRFNTSKACSNLNISRETVRRWRQEDPEFERSFNESTETMIDSAEEQLREQVKKGNMDAIKFVLSRLNRAKYAERVEVTGENSGPIQIVVNKTIVSRKQVDK